jgi:hypothetical protein
MNFVYRYIRGPKENLILGKEMTMNTLLIIVVLLLLFGGGGGYYYNSRR